MTTFKLKSEIPFIKSVKCFFDGVFYCSDKGLEFKGAFIRDVESQSFIVRDDALFYYNRCGDFCYFKNDKNLTLMKAGFFPETIESDNILLRFDNYYDSSKDSFSFKVGLFNLTKWEFVRNFESMSNLGVHKKFNGVYICSSVNVRNSLIGVDSITGTYLWESDLSEYCKILSVSNEPAQGMIRQVFGVWRDKLWVGFDGNQYASLDLNTGKVLQYFKLNEINEIFQEVNALSPYFDKDNGLLCFLENKIYAEINLNTLRVERKKSFLTDNTETDWNFSSNTFSESHVYFVATRASSRFSPNYVGVFDRATMEVVWSKDLELYKLPPVKNMPARFLAQAPQSDGDKLYVLDTHGTLHIFEKIEENEYSQA